MPLTLTDAQMDLLTQLSLPIDLDRRPLFMADVAGELEAAGSAIAEGSLHRVARVVQRRYYDPPALTSDATAPRHRLVRA
jgi:hypothetical protein